ncbi:hypothetical protein BK816_03035 [Boudabousia tangfeifanii]|uniref:Uncharacterized protein n=1 Tax=Boudabousia tangfeifanii TaxID=1912795 RepID=A0A1D9MJC0_9ACTO|nr:hypothetical protein BK816_03035 [Boudabousia tangfeifanii]
MLPADAHNGVDRKTPRTKPNVNKTVIKALRLILVCIFSPHFEKDSDKKMLSRFLVRKTQSEKGLRKNTSVEKSGLQTYAGALSWRPQ